MAAMKSDRLSKRRKLSPIEDDVTESSSRKRKSQPNSKVDTAIEHDEQPKSNSTSDQVIDMPSVKGLDSSEPAIRRSTLKTILDHLESRPSSAPLSPIQCLQLWRGLFVVVYMHDSRNTLSVQNVLREIGHTFTTFSTKDEEWSSAEVSAKESNPESAKWLNTYHTAFWETVQREWAQIDSHRMNKYLLLIRFVLRNLFSICLQSVLEQSAAAKKSSLKSQTKKTRGAKVQKDSVSEIASPAQLSTKTRQCLVTLQTVGPLNPSLRKIPDGLRLHIFDIWNDELFGALSDLETSQKSEEDESDMLDRHQKDFMPLFQQLRASLNKTTPGDSGAQKHVRTRAKEAVKEMDEQLKARSIEIED